MKYKFMPVVLIACLLLAACVDVPLTYQPTIKNLETINASNMAPVNVGKFALSPTADPEMDKSVTARAATVISPIENSFSQFLKDSLAKELRAAGKYEPNSHIVIRGQLNDSKLNCPIGTGSASLSATFWVDKNGQVAYQKELKENTEWPSGFVGAEAIPAAINQYIGLYQKLLGQLFSDADFQKATQK